MSKLLAAVVVASLSGCMGESDEEIAEDSLELKIPTELKGVRAATARFHDLQNALDAGFLLGNWTDDFENPPVVAGCVVNPTPGVGAMGFHYFNVDRYEDPTIVLEEPEALLYEPNEDGELKLVAVEWVVKKETWHDAGHLESEHPMLNDQTLHILNPMLNWYLLHGWIWKENPTGVYKDWNPDVTCPPP